MKFSKSKYVTRPDGSVERLHYQHRVARIGLRLGDQGIPDGFEMTACCGENDDASSIDLEARPHSSDKPCPKCFPVNEGYRSVP